MAWSLADISSLKEGRVVRLCAAQEGRASSSSGDATKITIHMQGSSHNMFPCRRGRLMHFLSPSNFLFNDIFLFTVVSLGIFYDSFLLFSEVFCSLLCPNSCEHVFDDHGFLLWCDGAFCPCAAY